MLSRFLKLSYHFAVYAVGVCVLLTAVAVTIGRLLLPDIGSYREEIQAWVSRNMGYPVVIHHLEASWEGWVPNLYLRDIDLMNRQGTAVITHFDSAQVSIAPLASLWQRSPVPGHLTVSGVRLWAVRQADGSLYFELELDDAWVWDMYRPARFVKRVKVMTFRDVNIEELEQSSAI